LLRARLCACTCVRACACALERVVHFRVFVVGCVRERTGLMLPARFRSAPTRLAVARGCGWHSATGTWRLRRRRPAQQRCARREWLLPSRGWVGVCVHGRGGCEHREGHIKRQRHRPTRPRAGQGRIPASQKGRTLAAQVTPCRREARDQKRRRNNRRRAGDARGAAPGAWSAGGDGGGLRLADWECAQSSQRSVRGRERERLCY